MTKAMNIIFLDAHTTNPGDLSWDELHTCGNVTIYPHTKPEDFRSRAFDADIIITNKHIIGAGEMDQCPNLKAIMIAATGMNNVDLDAAEKRNIIVNNVSGYSTSSVVQWVFAALLEAVNHIAYYNSEVRSGRWVSSRDFSFFDHSIADLNEMTMGIIGLGTIGRKVADVADSFGMKVIGMNRYPEKWNPDYFENVTFDQLLSTSDVISLHIPLTPANKHMINRSALKKMKPEAILINSARGPIIDESALSDHSAENPKFVAMLDVLSKEPAEKNNPVLNHHNIKITPHIAWASKPSRRKLITGIVNNIRALG